MDVQAGSNIYWFTAEDIKNLVSEALHGRARQWEEEAHKESLRGSANRAKIETLMWGAVELKGFAQLVQSIPPYEVRESVPSEPESLPEVQAEADKPKSKGGRPRKS